MDISFFPNWIINYFTKDFLKQNDLNILLSNLFIVIVFILFRNVLIDFLNLIPHFCLFDKLTGIECPVCGITRGLCEISSGHFEKALNYNYSSLFIFSIFIFQISLRFTSLFLMKSFDKVNTISKYYSIITLTCVLIIWFFKIYVESRNH
jgi:hypothetical protein